MRTQALAWMGAIALWGCSDPESVNTLPDGADGSDASDDGSSTNPKAFSISYVTPSSGLPQGQERVTIYGEELDQVVAVRFGGERAQNLAPFGSTQLTVVSPPHAPGLVAVELEHRDGRTITLNEGYLYRSGWSAREVLASATPYQGGQRIQLAGEGLSPDLVVLVGGRRVTDVRFEGEGVISGVLPGRSACESAQASVLLSDTLEVQTLEASLQYAQPLQVQTLSRASSPQQGHEVVRLQGRGLSQVAEVKVGSRVATLVPPTHLSQDEWLDIELPAHPQGLATVTLVTPHETLTLTNALFYRAPEGESGPLAIASVFPAEPRMGDTLRIVLGGAGAMASQTPEVTLDGRAVPVLRHQPSLGEIEVQLPEGAPASSLRVSLGGQSATLALATKAQVVLQSVSPNHLPLTGGEVTLEGKGLDQLTGVLVDGQPAEILSKSASSARLRVPASVSGRADIVLQVDDWKGLSCEALEFRAPAEAAAFWGLSPQSGAQAGGRVVRLWGQGFQAQKPSTATFGEQAVSVEVLSDHEALVKVPRGDVGSVHVGLGALGRFGMAWRYFDPTQSYGGTSGGPSDEALNVTVLNAYNSAPVADAVVVLGSDFEGPYVGRTDRRGQITFSDLYFEGPFEVTASARAHTSTTVAGFEARDLTLRIYSLTIPPPSTGGGGGSTPTPANDGEIGGYVSGFDKYIVNPVGQCDFPFGAEHDLCAPCQADSDCRMGRCIYLEDQGSHCSQRCDSDAACPAGFSCISLDEGAHCVPSPGLREVDCQVSQGSMFSPAIGFNWELFAPGYYSLMANPGEVSVLCLGGVRGDNFSFDPLAMGVLRNINVLSDQVSEKEDVALTIPLTRRLRVRFDMPGPGLEPLYLRQASFYLESGAEGYFLWPYEINTQGGSVWEINGLPERFDGPLDQMRLGIYAAVRMPSVGIYQDSYVLMNFDDLDASGLWFGANDSFKSARLDTPIYALARTTSEVWAASTKGRLWRLQQGQWRPFVLQTPRSILALSAEADSLYVAGEHGLIAHLYQNQVQFLSGPAGAEKARWTGILKQGEALWVWGEAGLYGLKDGVWLKEDIVPDLKIQSVTWAFNNLWVLDTEHHLWRKEGNWVRVPDLSDLPEAIAGLDSVLWVVGRNGRIWRFDGAEWFAAYSPVKDTLRALALNSPTEGYATGDNGVLLAFDGLSWELVQKVENLDGCAVSSGPEGPILAGLPTWIVGPFLEPAELVSPSPATERLRDLTLQIAPPQGAKADFHWASILSNNFPIWRWVTSPDYTSIRLPDFMRSAGFQPLYTGQHTLQFVRASWDAFSIDAFSDQQLNAYYWKAWSVTQVPVTLP